MKFLFVAMEFLCGSLMFSYWLGLAAKKDLKSVGDGNPGAFNLWSAAGFKYGIAGIFLDFLKGYLPLVFLIETGSIREYWVLPAAIAPILGHAFSPFLKFKGGKAIAVTFGVWSAVTRFESSLAYAVILAVLLLLSRIINRGKPTSSDSDGFQVVFGFLLLLLYLVWRSAPSPILWLWLANFMVLAYTNRNKLSAFTKKLFAGHPPANVDAAAKSPCGGDNPPARKESL